MKDFTPELRSFLDLLTGIELKSNQHRVINNKFFHQVIIFVFGDRMPNILRVCAAGWRTKTNKNL